MGLGYKFYLDENYPKIVDFCNQNNYVIAEIGEDEKGFIYQIQETPKLTEEQVLNNLRMKREIECFSVINRGVLWYNMLTEEQRLELDIWYKKWLDVTETMVIPEKPSWLEE